MTLLPGKIFFVACYAFLVFTPSQAGPVAGNHAYLHSLILELRFGEADRYLAGPGKGNSPYLIYLVDLRYFLQAILRQDRISLDLYRTKSRECLQALEKSTGRNPGECFARAELLLRAGLVEALDGNYLPATRYLFQSKRLTDENIGRFPGEKLFLKTRAQLIFLAGLLPADLEFAAPVLGIENDWHTGRSLVNALTQAYPEDDPFYSELRILDLAGLLLFEKERDTDVFGSHLPVNEGRTGNPVYALLQALALRKSGRNDILLDHLRSQTEARLKQVPFLRLLLAEALLRKLDGTAGSHLEKFLDEYKGGNYRPYAQLLLAWHYFLNGDGPAPGKFVSGPGDLQTARIWADRQAHSEAGRTDQWRKELLGARLLSDGGYIAQSTAVLQAADTGLWTEYGKLEFIYRLGRNHQESGDSREAIRYYNTVISRGSGEPYYFAANAALQAGMIYQGMGMNGQAAACYRKCLAMPVREYRWGIRRKAREALFLLEKEGEE